VFAILHRAFTDSFLVFDTAWKAIGLTVLVAAVTALLVLIYRRVAHPYVEGFSGFSLEFAGAPSFALFEEWGFSPSLKPYEASGAQTFRA
jgi:hypothetical protein